MNLKRQEDAGDKNYQTAYCSTAKHEPTCLGNGHILPDFAFSLVNSLVTRVISDQTMHIFRSVWMDGQDLTVGNVTSLQMKLTQSVQIFRVSLTKVTALTSPAAVTLGKE